MKTAILLGATGLTGTHLMNVILNDDQYEKLVIFVRREVSIQHPKLEQHVIDFDKPESYKDLVKGDDMFCCLGTTIKKAGSQAAFTKIDMDYPLCFARIAFENGVKRYLLISSIGADKTSSNFYLRIKGLCEEAISQLPFSSVSIFRPSILIGNRDEFRLGEKLSVFLVKAFSFVLVGKLKKYRGIKSSQVALAMYNNAQSDVRGVNIYQSDEIQEM